MNPPSLIALLQRLETVQERLLVAGGETAPLDALPLHDLVEAERPHDGADAPHHGAAGHEDLLAAACQPE